MLFKFIWSNGNDRVKRDFLCNDYDEGGLRMINPLVFAQAQKMSWVARLLDENYNSAWKVIELKTLI